MKAGGKSYKLQEHGRIFSSSKLNFSVHLIPNCLYFENLLCRRFNSDLDRAVCQDKSESVRCCWLPSWVKDGYQVVVLRGGVLRV